MCIPLQISTESPDPSRCRVSSQLSTSRSWTFGRFVGKSAGLRPLQVCLPGQRIVYMLRIVVLVFRYFGGRRIRIQVWLAIALRIGSIRGDVPGAAHRNKPLQIRLQVDSRTMRWRPVIRYRNGRRSRARHLRVRVAWSTVNAVLLDACCKSHHVVTKGACTAVPRILRVDQF